MGGQKVALTVPRRLVKQVKSALEAQELLDRNKKITAAIPKDEGDQTESCMVIHTTFPYDPSTKESPLTVLVNLQLNSIACSNISISPYTPDPNQPSTPSNNPLLAGLKNGLQALPDDLLASLDLTAQALLASFPDAYSIYKPLLLLPPNAFTSPSWTALLSTYAAPSPALQPLWASLASSTGTTHIAVNAGIPLQKNHAPTLTPTTSTPASKEPLPSSDPENTLRSPINLTPLYPPSFTSSPITQQTISTPSPSDLASALWVSHTQNGIHQVWAPQYTMFSRGNIKEKARLLSLPSVTSSVAATNTNRGEKGCTAVDLYAGIGYFAFSYRRTGVKKVLCWELNPWSIEGLRRGAERNRWRAHIVGDTNIPASKQQWEDWADELRGGWARKDGDVDFVVLQQSNEFALDAIAALQRPLGSASSSLPEAQSGAVGEVLPPIRHVNCGFLPSSQLSWPTAIRALDRELGGWIHAHENVGIADIEARAAEVVAEMQALVDTTLQVESEGGRGKRRVSCVHIERVKTYAPGVMHVVFDVWVSGVEDED